MGIDAFPVDAGALHHHQLHPQLNRIYSPSPNADERRSLGDGLQRQAREFGGFRRDCVALAAWLVELRVELVVMESTGI